MYVVELNHLSRAVSGSPFEPGESIPEIATCPAPLPSARNAREGTGSTPVATERVRMAAKNLPKQTLAREVKSEASPPRVNRHGCEWGCGAEKLLLEHRPIAPAVMRSMVVGFDPVMCCRWCAGIEERAYPPSERWAETLDPIEHTWRGAIDIELAELAGSRSEHDALVRMFRGER